MRPSSRIAPADKGGIGVHIYWHIFSVCARLNSNHDRVLMRLRFCAHTYSKPLRAKNGWMGQMVVIEGGTKPCFCNEHFKFRESDVCLTKSTGQCVDIALFLRLEV